MYACVAAVVAGVLGWLGWGGLWLAALVRRVLGRKAAQTNNGVGKSKAQ